MLSASGDKPVHELMHIRLRNRTQNSRLFVRNVSGISILYTNCSIRYYAERWAMLESNQRPQACHACTLTN